DRRRHRSSQLVNSHYAIAELALLTPDGVSLPLTIERFGQMILQMSNHPSEPVARQRRLTITLPISRGVVSYQMDGETLGKPVDIQLAPAVFRRKLLIVGFHAELSRWGCG
ncbi:hypothetical protein, partial [Agrobacterium sp. ST15.13.013]|uniref:hypothetical protein n=1 Tax=Agrobacterium sp. ST15.13.013 TaxID=3020525 RepID=UPI002300923B